MPSGLEIIAESPDGPLSVQIQIDAENNLGSNGMLHKLAAVKSIRELEMKVAGLSYEYEYGTQDVTSEADLKKEIVRIGCLYGLASKYTSFVAVDSASNSTANDNWVMQTRYVPSQYANGTDMDVDSANPNPGACGPADRGSRRRCRGRCASAGPGNDQKTRKRAKSCSPMRKRRCSSHSSQSQPKKSSSSKKRRASCQPKKSRSASAPRQRTHEVVCGSASSSTPTPQDKLQALVATQSYDGSFNLNEDFGKAIGKTLDSLLKEAKKNGWTAQVWATALALTYLNKKLSALEESWELVEGKATKWLKKNFGEVDKVLAAAKAFLS